MLDLVLLLGALAGAVGLLWLWQGERTRRLARDRLGAPALPAVAERPAPLSPDEPFVRRHFWIALAVGLLAFLLLRLAARLNLLFAATGGAIVTLLATRFDAARVARRELLIETQLADALDLMISALRAGGGVMSALELAARETRAPLREQLQELLGRVRYGDDPQEVLRALEKRVPLETFRLFCAALSVHWEVGGSLAPLLATVGRTIRDRIELSRRVRSLTVQSRVSTVAILATTYFIALVVWRNDPQRMTSFLSTSLGQQLVAFAMLLQAVGIVWSSALSKLRF